MADPPHTTVLDALGADDVPDPFRVHLPTLSQVYGGGPMLFDFSEPERNTARRALEIYVSDLREEIVKTEKHEWRQALHEEKEILEGVIEQLSI